jgi:hypothetical protein
MKALETIMYFVNMGLDLFIPLNPQEFSVLTPDDYEEAILYKNCEYDFKKNCWVGENTEGRKVELRRNW